MAAPIGSQVLGEVLPYLEVNKDNIDEIETKEEVEVPNLVGLTIKEASNLLKEKQLELELDFLEGMEIDKEEVIIKTQLPKPGIKITQGNKIVIEI